VALVTQENVDFVNETLAKAETARRQAGIIIDKLREVQARIDPSKGMNANTDWDTTIVPNYLPKYEAALTEMKTAAVSLPRWGNV